MSPPKAGNARQFLIFLDQGLGFAGYFGGRNLNLDFPFGAATGFGGGHFLPFAIRAGSLALPESTEPNPHVTTALSVKTEGEQRQTTESNLGPI
jgi:hypothetical protein